MLLDQENNGEEKYRELLIHCIFQLVTYCRQPMPQSQLLLFCICKLVCTSNCRFVVENYCTAQLISTSCQLASDQHKLVLQSHITYFHAQICMGTSQELHLLERFYMQLATLRKIVSVFWALGSHDTRFCYHASRSYYVVHGLVASQLCCGRVHCCQALLRAGAWLVSRSQSDFHVSSFIFVCRRKRVQYKSYTVFVLAIPKECTRPFIFRRHIYEK